MPRAPLTIPVGLDWWRAEPGGEEWLSRLPELAAQCARRWSLELGAPIECAHIAFVVPARRRDGSEAILKINFPEPESEHEAAALVVWDGAGSVRLLAREDEFRALLVERCRPGAQLWTVAEEEAIEIAAAVLRTLWRRPPDNHPFRLLRAEAARWADELPVRWEGLGRPFEPELIEESVAFLRDAASSERESVLVHQDFHGGNVLRATRGWLAIDPKPLVGEREFDTASLLRDRRWELRADPADFRKKVARRLDRLAGELSLDRERMRGWGIAHALAWGFERDGVLWDHVECARILAGTSGR